MGSEHDDAASGGSPEPPEASEPVEELFYYDGNWYLYKAAPIVPPKFDFSADLKEFKEARERNRQIIRDTLLSVRIVQPIPICRITGV